jgi:hypothetical protein
VWFPVLAFIVSFIFRLLISFLKVIYLTLLLPAECAPDVCSHIPVNNLIRDDVLACMRMPGESMEFDFAVGPDVEMDEVDSVVSVQPCA